MATPSRPPSQILELEALIDRLAAAGAAPAVWAHLRVRVGARVRDLLLGSRTQIAGDLTVLDWRTAPLAEVYFRNRVGDDYEVAVDDHEVTGTVLGRHRLAVVGGRLREVADDDATWRRDDDGWTRWPADAADAAVPATLQGPRPSRSLLPELDAEQRAAVELAPGRSLAVDGEAGVGKTLVALYRLAWLKRRADDAGRPLRALVLVPTEGLRRLARRLLERMELDRAGIEVAVVDAWLVERAQPAFRGLPSRLSEGASAQVIALKRHPAVRVAIDELIGVRAPVDPELRLSKVRADLLHLFGDRHRLERVVAAARGALPAAAVGAVARHTRIQFTDTTEQAHRDVDADRLVAIDGRALDAGTPLEDAGTFDREDVPVLFELARRRAASHRGADPAAKLPRYDHVVVDEAQLLAPLELAAIGAALAPRGTVTISGDHRQATDDTACFRGWALAAEELGVDAEPVTLTTTYRSGPAITAFARALAAGPATPTPGDEIRVSTFASELHAIDQIGGALAALRPRDRGVTVAVVARNDAHARRVHRELERAVEATLVQGGAFTFLPGVVVTSCAEVAGLEFDAVVIAELTPGFYPDTDEARRALYVACTRARDWLWLTTVGPWSPLLGPTT